jgi:hypothetical protein
MSRRAGRAPEDGTLRDRAGPKRLRSAGGKAEMTMTASRKRDYSLVGESTKLAIETGLASAEWYHTDVSRKAIKELMQRSDGPAIRDTIIWIVAILASAAGIIWFWGTWWVRAVLVRLWRALRLIQRLALARMRPRHRLPDAVDERCRLPDRQLHDHAKSGARGAGAMPAITPTPSSSAAMPRSP